jgi:hypothetical protein
VTSTLARLVAISTLPDPSGSGAARSRHCPLSLIAY